MADIELVTTDEIETFDSVVAKQLTAVAAVAVTAGEIIRLNTDGEWVLADASAAETATGCYIAGLSKPAGQPVTGFKTVKVDGFDLDELDFGDGVYLSDTAGAVADAPGTVELLIGRVIPGMSERVGNAPKKLLAVDIGEPATGAEGSEGESSSE